MSDADKHNKEFMEKFGYHQSGGAIDLMARVWAKARRLTWKATVWLLECGTKALPKTPEE